MTKKENPAPRVNAEGRAQQIQEQHGSVNIARGEAPDFAATYVALRYRLPLPIAAVIARLAELGGALS